MRRDFIVFYVEVLWHVWTAVAGKSAMSPRDDIEHVQRVISGDEVRLRCSIQSQDEMFWLHDSVIITAGRTIFRHSVQIQTDDVNTYDVIIKSATEADQGLYQCQAVPSRFHSTTYLWVDVPPSISLFYPGTSSVELHVGDALQLDCRATGRPPPTVTWTHKGEALSQSTRHVLTEATSSEAGVYECVADNGVGSAARRQITVNVLYRPVVSVSNSEVHVGLDQPLTLECYVDASPRARLSWKHNGSDVIGRVGVIIISQEMAEGGDVSILRVDRCDVTDVGEYTCEGENRLGYAADSIVVTGIPDRLMIESDSSGQYSDQFELRWSVRSASPLVETLLRLRSVPPTASNRSTDELRKIVTDYSQLDKLMTRSAVYVIDELTASSVYSVALRTRNGFGFSDWTVEFYFETAPEGHDGPSRHAARRSSNTTHNSQASSTLSTQLILLVLSIVGCQLLRVIQQHSGAAEIL